MPKLKKIAKSHICTAKDPAKCRYEHPEPPCKQKKGYAKHEQAILALLEGNPVVEFLGREYRVTGVGKPRATKARGGEPKTDIYTRLIPTAKNPMAPSLEVKLTIKLENAAYVENKLNTSRVKSVFGAEGHMQYLLEIPLPSEVVEKNGRRVVGYRFDVLREPNRRFASSTLFLFLRSLKCTQAQNSLRRSVILPSMV